MSDIEIGITDRSGRLITTNPDYVEYSFDSQVYTIADSFFITLADTRIDMTDWYGVQLRIDQITVFNGVIQRTQRSTSKGSHDITLSGKDRGLFLVDTFCSKLKDHQNTSPKVLVERLIDQTQFYSQVFANFDTLSVNIDWDDPQDIQEFNDAISDNVKNNRAFTTAKDLNDYGQGFLSLPPKSSFKIERGEMVGERIIDLVRSVGFDVLYLQDGTLFFGDITKRRLEDIQTHRIYLTREDSAGKANNVIEADVVFDQSGRYSDVTVVSQPQNGKNDSATATDSTVVDKKSMLIEINDDDISPKKEAIRIREDQRFESLSAVYTVSDHVDLRTGDVWGLNTTVRVEDEINQINGEFVIYGRTFTFSPDTGTQTSLNISFGRQDVLKI